MTKHVYGADLNDENGNHIPTAWEEYCRELGETPAIWPSQPQAAPEYPDNNPKTSVGAKKLPLHLVPPSAVHALAASFADGAAKYGPYNWRAHQISSSVYYAAALRHLMAWWDGEEVTADSGVGHVESALACLAMIIDAKSVGKLNDNRPTPGAASRMQEAWLKKKDNGSVQV